MRSVSVAVLSLALAGCGLLTNTRSTQTQLERVAKDWCQTIRASQVLCVYPLSEDVQVGDVYLVSTPIGSEAKEYARRGFLSFDTLLTRLQPVGYERMYLDAYGTKDFYAVLPHQWQFPASGGTPTAWSSAPRAAFPSYTFAVSRGQGLKLAVPLQSVPVGLSLMNSGKAYGSIEIADAATYGVDQQSIDAQVDAWAQCPNARALLSRYQPVIDAKTGKETEPQYVRVITRVYLTGRMNVTLTNDEQRGGGVDAGIAQAVNVLEATDGGAANANAAKNYADVIAALNQSVNSGLTGATGATGATGDAAANGTLGQLAAAKAGGSIRIAAASSRGITMSESFDRPLVVGYIAYDRPIGRGGKLGASTATLIRVEGRDAPEPPKELPQENVETTTKYGVDANSMVIRAWLAEEKANLQALRDWLTRKNLDPALIPSYVKGADYVALRQQIVEAFGLGGVCGT